MIYNIDYDLQDSNDVVAVFGEKAETSRFFTHLIFSCEGNDRDIKIKFYTELGEAEIFNLFNLLNSKSFSRAACILSKVNVDGIGLEIGPLDKPIMPKTAL